MLTEREIEVVAGVALGLSNREIAEGLFISERTVGSHLGRIAKTLGMGDRAGIASLGFKHGWLAWDGDNLVVNVPKRRKARKKTLSNEEWWAKTLTRLFPESA